MAESRKPTLSSVDPKVKKSAFADDDFGSEFLGSWKSLSVAEDDGMDFGFDTISTGKKKQFNFDKLDMDFDLDGDFGKLTSFKMDMPDLDFSSPSKKTAKSKESSKGESSDETHQGKPEHFDSSFDFNEFSFDLDSTLTKGKFTSAKNSDLKDDGAVRTEQEGSKLNLPGGNEASDVCQTDNLPASENATASTVETTVQGAPLTDDASNNKCSLKEENVGELASAQTSPKDTLSVKADQQISVVEKAKSTEPIAPVTTEVIPAQSFDKDDSTQATESDSEADPPASRVCTESVEEHNVPDRKVDDLGSGHGNLKLNDSVTSHNKESGSNRVESKKADNEIPDENMIETVQMQDDFDVVTSAATITQASSQSDTPRDIQKPASMLLTQNQSEHAAEKVVPIKENEPEVVISKIVLTSNVTEPQLCQPSSADIQVFSSVDKGLANSHGVCDIRVGTCIKEPELGSSNILQRSIETETQLGQPSPVSVQVFSSVSKGLSDSYRSSEKSSEGIRFKEPGAGSSKILKSTIETKPQLCQTSSVGVRVSSAVNKGLTTSYCVNGKREDVNGDRMKNASKLGTILRRPVKDAKNEDSVSLRSGINNKDLNNFGGSASPASLTDDEATKSNPQKNTDSTTVVSSINSSRNLKIGSFEGLKSGRRTTDLPSLKISRNTGVSNDHYDVMPKRDSSSLRNLQKEMEARGSAESKIVHPVERKISPITSLKRKSTEASNSDQVLLHPQKRLSQSPIQSRSLKEPMERTAKLQCNQPEKNNNATICNTSVFEKQNNKEESILLTMESDQNVQKAEEYAKELEDMCNMLKKKHEEAKELLVRAIVNNNQLLMLNHPMFDAKIQRVKKFAAQLVSKCS